MPTMKQPVCQGSRRPAQERRRGAVLLISLALLALLSLFALAFVKLVNFERRASTNYTDSVRARMLARAGIQHAIVALQDIAGERHYSDPRKDTWYYELVPPPNSVMTQQQREALDLPLNLQITQEPSFKLKNLGPLKTNSDPLLNRCAIDIPNGVTTHNDGGECANDPVFYRAKLAVSGMLASTYNEGLDCYKLKVIDAASQLNLNHPDPAAAQMMLKNLLRAAAVNYTGTPTWTILEAPANAIAAHVILNRPTSGFRSKAEVQALLTVDPAIHGLATSNCPCKDGTVGPANGALNLVSVTAANRVTDTRWDEALRDLVTVRSWVDEKVIRPWNLNPDLPANHYYYEPGKRALPLMARSPINLNTARKPVLSFEAVLAAFEPPH
jgi:hypothetical protein